MSSTLPKPTRARFINLLRPPMRWSSSWILLAALGGALLGGCRPSGAVHSALHDDLEGLRKSIAAEQRESRIDQDRAREIAAAVLQREVFSARGEQALTRVRALRDCSSALYDVLHERAQVDDDIGAEALQILLEGRQLRNSPFEHYKDSPDGAWRAVAARDTESPKLRGQRMAYFADPDERVRRAALEAAVAAPDSRDTEVLLEVVRVDPDPIARGIGIEALGHIGTERVVLALKDRWPQADEPLRRAIVDAWKQRPTFQDGGKAELIRLVESSSEIPALHAAHALARLSEDEASAIGLQKLVAAARSGSREERRLALLLLPDAAPDSVQALRDAAKDPDPEVAVLAAARLLDVPEERQQAQKSLAETARGRGLPALQARAALAAAGDPSVVPLLLAQLEDPRASHRKSAAIGLLRLGRFNDAAPIFADASPSVRSEVACELLSERAR